MKKKFLNDIFAIIVALLMIAFSAACMILALINPRYQEPAKIVGLAVCFGFFMILGIVLLSLVFELIYVYENKIVSVKIFKRTEIFYNEIVSIRNTDKNWGIGTWPSYEFSDSSKNKIEILSSKKRDKIVEEIKSKINLVDDV